MSISSEEGIKMYLETERLILRDYESSDGEAYFNLKSDAETMYYLQDIQLFSKKEADRELENILQDKVSENRKLYFFHIELRNTCEPVGSIGYYGPYTSWEISGCRLFYLS